MRRNTSPLGFSLLEMAIVLIVVGLLLGSAASSFVQLVEFKKIEKNKQELELIRDALINYAVLNQRLPCPAALSSKGLSAKQSDSEACLNPNGGYVPAVELGLSEVTDQGLILDAWNRPIKYAVTQENSYAYVTKEGVKNNFKTGINPNLRVCAGNTTSNSSCMGSMVLTDSSPAVVYSSGPNGIFESHLNESLSAFVYHESTSADSYLGEFDDQLVWISNPVLIGRMVQTW